MNGEATGGRFTTETGSAAGKQSAAVRKRLTLAEVEKGLGELQTVEDAKRRLERLGVWLTAGMVTGSQGGAAVRATEQWLKAHSEELDRNRLREAEKRVRTLEKELADVRGRTLGVI